MTDKEYMLAITRETGGHGEYKHTTGKFSIVLIAVAALGYKKIRIANLPPEVPEETPRTTLAPFGKVLDIKEEMWARIYRYAVANGIRQVTVLLTQHKPSHLTIAGQRVLRSYEGQPATCYGCGDTGHLYQSCPRMRRRAQVPTNDIPSTYAAVKPPQPPPHPGNPRGIKHKVNRTSKWDMWWSI